MRDKWVRAKRGWMVGRTRGWSEREGCHQGDFWVCNWLARRRRQRSTDVDVSWLEWSNTESLSNRLMARRNLCLLWSRTWLYAAARAICHLQCQWNGSPDAAALQRGARIDRSRANDSISRSSRHRRRWRDHFSRWSNAQSMHNRCNAFRRASVTFELVHYLCINARCNSRKPCVCTCG